MTKPNKIQPVIVKIFDFHEIRDALIAEFPDVSYLKDEFDYDFYDTFNTPSDGAIHYHLAGSVEEWQDYASDMPVYFYMDYALHYFCDIPWGGSAYIITDY